METNLDYTADRLALELAGESIQDFTTFTKSDYQVNWHHELLCKYLDRFANWEITRLMVMMPPRVGKSELVSRRLPAYLFGRNPNELILGASYSDDLATRMNRDVQRIIESDSYRSIFPATKLNEKNVVTNSHMAYLRNSSMFEIVNANGSYRSSGVGGGITGMGFNTVIIDDPIKNQKEADSKRFRDTVWDWYTSTLFTRLEKKGRILLTLTRWHEDDLAGRLLLNQAEDPEPWTVISFPMIREDMESAEDPRKLGEPLWEDKYDLTRCNEIKGKSSRVWQSLYQQKPTAQTGSIIKRSWIKFYGPHPDCEIKLTQDQLMKTMTKLVQSWDMAFKDSDKSDFVVGQLWGKQNANIFFFDQVRDRMGFTETIAALKLFTTKHPRALKKLIEEKANGAAVIDSVKKHIQGIVPINPKDSKESRLNAVSPLWEAGNVYLPHPSIAPWVSGFIEELVGFGTQAHDDQVDAMTQALDELSEHGGYSLQKMVQL